MQCTHVCEHVCHVCICTYVCACMCLFVGVCRHSGKNHLPGYMHEYIHVYVCVCARVCAGMAGRTIYLDTYMHTCICVCVCRCVQAWWEGPFTWIHVCIHVCVCVCTCMVGSTVYLDKAHRILHDVFSPKKVESLVFHSNRRVEDPHWHAGHRLPDVADTVISLHGAHDLVPLANPPNGEDEVLVGSASVGVAGRQHGLPWPPLIEFQGEDVDLGTGHTLPHSHAPQHVDAAVQGDG